MSLHNYFLPSELQNQNCCRYLNNVLSYPLPRLEKELETLKDQSKSLSNHLSSRALTQTKDFVQNLGDASDLLTQGKAINSQLRNCLEKSSSFSSLLQSNSTKLHKNLNDQRSLRVLKQNQNVISEVLELPGLIKTVLNAKHYSEALQLCEFAEGLFEKFGSEVLKGLSTEVAGLKAKTKEDMLEQLTESSIEKTQEIFGLLNYSGQELAKLYLSAKEKQLQKKFPKHTLPAQSIKSKIATCHKLLPRINTDFKDLFSSHQKELNYFVFKQVKQLYQELKKTLYEVESFSDLKEIISEFLEFDQKVLSSLGISLSKEFKPLVTQVFNSKLEVLCEKTLAHFENMVKLYQWESSGQKENPLLEFGSIAALYNNCICIINHVR